MPTNAELNSIVNSFAARLDILETFKKDKETIITGLTADLEEKTKTIERLTKRIKDLEDKLSNANTSVSMPYLAAALAKPGSEANRALLGAIASNAKSSVNKAKNAVFIGVPSPTSDNLPAKTEADKLAVTKILNDLNLNPSIVSVRRIKPRPTELTSTENESLPPPPLIVEFASPADRNSVISAATALASTSHNNIYIRPDRTIAEQSAFNDLNNERKKANLDLVKFGNFNTPFRFIICSDRVRCIDVSKTLDINGRKVFPFVDKQTANRARTARYIQSE